MTKQAWNWLNTVVFTIAGGALGHYGYLLLQEKDMERGDWRWVTVGWVLVVVMQTMNLWDDSRRRRNAAGAPGLATGQVPKEAGTD